MAIVTRFAPSPTGYLHIGGARTALFNWLFARHHGGKFLLRIEDTDRARSTQEAIDAILKGLKWLDLEWDGDVIYQFSRANRHAEVAHQLLAQGKAYHCYCTPEELEEMRATAMAQGRQPKYDGRWRDRNPATAPAGIQPVIRLKSPQEGHSQIHDNVQGQVTVDHSQIDDFVLLRGDGTPTFMLSVVVDDHDMGVTHIIRGDDHFTNSFRQKQLYDALCWDMPDLTHIPLIHGPDGTKLSKRHGALGIEAYAEMGILPEAMCNYLLRLGWSHGDDELITRQQATNWFNLENIGKSPARLDMDKLMHVNSHYLRQRPLPELIELINPKLAQEHQQTLTPETTQRLLKGLPGLIERSKNLNDLASFAVLYTQDPPYPFDDKATSVLTQPALAILSQVKDFLSTAQDWSEANLEAQLREFAERQGLKFGAIAQPLRAALTGRAVSPGIFEVMATLGQKPTLERLDYVQLTFATL